MSYLFIRSEEEGSFDYTFYAKANKRVYTVTFDPTLYEDIVNDMPTLLTESYGMLFYYVEGVKGANNFNYDPKVKETIQNIIVDFLTTKGDKAFIVYQCEAHKQGIFNKWYNCSHNEKITTVGIYMEEDPSNLQFFGFITHKANKLVNRAMLELFSFSIKLGDSEETQEPLEGGEGEEKS